MDLTEAEDIKKRWQDYPELYKEDLHDPDNHGGVIIQLESDILESEVKWMLGSITMNKASGGDGIPIELFQTLKDDAVKVLPMAFSKQEYWSGLPFPPRGDLPHPGIEPTSPAWQADSLPLIHRRSPTSSIRCCKGVCSSNG